MKVCIIQPYYSTDVRDLDRCYHDMLALMDKCDDSLDLIVLPEYCDVPAATENGEQFHASVLKYNADFRKKASETAKRCHALLFANFADLTETGMRNTTFAFDREGNVIGKYYKTHPAPSEVKPIECGGNGFDCSYSYTSDEPYILEIEGIRFGFLTCYDFYMYEAYSRIAREKVDILIGCSHQRTDTHESLAIIGKFLSYQTNAYLLRSAVSMGADSKVCGCSMIVAPDGEMLADMKNEVGMTVYDIDPHKKYYKPAGYKGVPKAHYEYIEEGRRPWLYRPAGSMMIPDDSTLPYPRICAHRGFNSVAPENSMPAFGAAVALGADEFEFDIWSTKDGVLVSSHDPNLERVSDGTGNIWDYTYEELLQFDFGAKKNERFAGLRILTFEEILKKFARTAIMNIHIKIWDHEDMDPQFETFAHMLHKYDCEHHAYIMTSADKRSAEFHKIAPDIHRCVGFDGVKGDPLRIVNRAITLGCEKVQLFKPYFDQSSVDLAHEHGILCNVFYADDPAEACRYLDMGIDTILTNDYLTIANAVKKHLSEK